MGMPPTTPTHYTIHNGPTVGPLVSIIASAATDWAPSPFYTWRGRTCSWLESDLFIYSLCQHFGRRQVLRLLRIIESVRNRPDEETFRKGKRELTGRRPVVVRRLGGGHKSGRLDPDGPDDDYVTGEDE